MQRDDASPSDGQVPKSRPPPSAVRNRLLASLSADDYARIIPTLEIVPLPLKGLIQLPAHPVQHVYFPGGGFCSMVAVLDDGGMVEVATVGREGAVDVFAALDGGGAPALTMVQGETDTCYRMPIAAFRAEMDRRGAFYTLITRFTQALAACIMQSTACNAVHSVEQRLARWLLMAHDRMERDEFPLTQEFAAMMLGATRPTVTVVAGALQRAGLITYHRGRVKILDRENLEEASCECYRAASDRLNAVTNGGRQPESR